MVDETEVALKVLSDASLKDSKMFFDNFINEPRFLELFKDAGADDVEVRNDVRAKVWRWFAPEYERLKQRNVRQFHFHLPDCTSFLRFHRPDKFGDSLVGVRLSVEKANRDKVEVHGFEEGRILNGFRNVYPISYQGRHLGSVEISTSFKNIGPRLSQLFGHEYFFIVKKSIVEAKVFATERDNYKSIVLSEDFLGERELPSCSLVAELNRKIVGMVKGPLARGQGFVVETSLAGIDYHVVFSPVKNFKNETAAYLVAYLRDAFRKTELSKFVICLIFANLSLLAIVALFFFMEQKNEALKKAELEFKTIADFNYDGEYWVTPDKKFRYMSPSCEKITGYPPDCFLRNKDFLREITLPEDRRIYDEHEKSIHDTLEGGAMKFRLRHKSGKIVWIEHFCTPVTDDKGNNIGFRASNRDITERIEAEETRRCLEKKLANKEKIESLNIMAGSIAHKFNNSLAVVMANLEMGLDEPHDQGEMRHFMKQAYQAATMSAETSRLMLGYVGQYQIDKAHFAIEKVIESALHVVRGKVQNSFTTHLDIAEGLHDMDGDYGLVRDALTAVLQNSLEAVADQQGQGEVTIKVLEKECREECFHPAFRDDLVQEGWFLSIAVSDNGPGIPEDIIGKIFDPFFTTNFIGRGMGLAYVAGIMRSHRGGVKVESEPGKGTTIALLFPSNAKKRPL